MGGAKAGSSFLPLLGVALYTGCLSGIGYSQSPTSLFLCQSTSDQSGRVYTPNIPDFYFDHANAADFRVGSGSNVTTRTQTRGTTIIFAIPPESSTQRNCSGTVTAIQYCYQARNSDINRRRTIFRFLALTENASQFTVTNRFDVSTILRNTDCTDSSGSVQKICCSSTPLDNLMQFQITSSVFWLGVNIGPSGGRRPLAFADSNTVFRVQQYQDRSFGNGGPANGQSFTMRSPLNNRALLILRFLIDPDPVTTELSTTESVATDSATTTDQVTMSQTTSEQTVTFTMTPSIETTVGLGTAIQTITPATETTTEQSTEPVESTTRNGVSTDIFDEPGDASISGGSRGVSGGVIGGVVGGVVVGVLLILCVVILIAWMSRKNRRNKLIVNGSTAGSGDQGNFVFANAVYGLNHAPSHSSDKLKGSSDHYDYAGVGPHARFKTKDSEEDEDDKEYAYAEAGACSGSQLNVYEVPLDGNVPTPFENTYEMLNSAQSYEVPSVLTAETETGYSHPTDNALTSPDLEGTMEEEAIYQVPAMDIYGLYSQLSEFRTTYLPRKSVKLSEHLGSGQFGVVYKGVWSSHSGSEIPVAVKTLKGGSGEEDRVKFLQEAAIMGQFKHPNVVTMYGVVTEGEPVLIVLDLLLKGDLRNHLTKNGFHMDDHTLLKYCRQVAYGMAYLSSKAFVHRDLAARNILVSEDDVCKIADFGMSRDLVDENYYISHGGQIPVKWTAPEALHYKKYSTASDVWSYGALMYEIWSVGHKPFEAFSNIQVVRLLDTGYRLPPPPGCPRGLYAIMISCWHPLTAQRPTFTKITRQLTMPDADLLKWSEEDKSIHPEAVHRGTGLLGGEKLYEDLQMKYIKPDKLLNVYETK